jgi:mRNA interferase RelE/StbE
VKPYRLRVPASVDELVRTLHPDLKQKIRAGLDLIRNDSTSGKPLQDELASLRSLRVGRFRIIYRVGPGHTIELVSIGPRRTIYEETLRLLRRPPG